MPTRCNRGLFIADLIACSTCFRHHYVHHQELKSIIRVVAACRIWCFGFQVAGLVYSCGLCVRFAGCCSIPQTGCYFDNSESCINENAWKWCSRSQEQCSFRSDSEFSNASDAVTMQVLPLWKLEVLPLHKGTVKLTQKVTAQNDMDFQKLK